MKNRRARCTVLAIAAVLIAITVYQSYFATSITSADVDRIRTGMTLDEVVAAFRLSPTHINYV